jgi:hypothetical protein
VEIQDLTSLCEVGIGINFAFGIISKIREVATSYCSADLKSTLEDMRTSIGASADNGGPRVNAGVLIQRIDRVQSGSSAVNRWIEVLALVLALILVVTFSVGLWRAAVNPSSVLGEGWALLATVGAFGAPLFATGSHALVWLIVKIYTQGLRWAHGLVLGDIGDYEPKPTEVGTSNPPENSN